MEVFLKEMAERKGQPLQSAPQKSKFQSLYNISRVIWNTLTLVSSCITNLASHLRYIIPDIFEGLNTTIEEVLNLTRGEGFTVSEHLVTMQKEIEAVSLKKTLDNIFQITYQASKYILSAWWNIRIIIYQKIYSFLKNSIQSASVSSHSTCPGSKLSLMITKFTGLLHSVISTIL